MSAEFEKKAGVPNKPEITERKYEFEDPEIESLMLNICNDNFLNPNVIGIPLRWYLTKCLNEKKGHPARVVFIQMLFADLYSHQAEASNYKKH